MFFDALGVPYEYEKEGYDLGNGLLYLPDFWLPKQRCWIEIKPNSLTADGWCHFVGEDRVTAEKCGRLAEATEHAAYLLTGMPGDVSRSDWIGDMAPYLVFHGWDDEEEINGIVGWPHADGAQWFGRCPKCGFVDIAFEARTDRFGCGCNYRGRGPFDDSAIEQAEIAARQARFEHGARGR